jgi:macrodomain Ter protein organizer (MatP/YcbG family)
MPKPKARKRQDSLTKKHSYKKSSDIDYLVKHSAYGKSRRKPRRSRRG